MGEDSDQEREGKPKGADGILVCSKEANMNFDRAKTKGLAMRRRTIALYRKEQKNLKRLSSHQGLDTTTSHREYCQR